MHNVNLIAVSSHRDSAQRCDLALLASSSSSVLICDSVVPIVGGRMCQMHQAWAVCH